MLADCRIGELEFFGHCGGGGRLDPLETIDDSSFGIGEIFHLRMLPISEV